MLSIVRTNDPKLSAKELIVSIQTEIRVYRHLSCTDNQSRPEDYL